MSLFLAAQLGLKADDLIEYATREETRHDHMSALRSIYGYRAFSGRAARDLKLWLDGQAEDARSNEDLARRLVEECRRSMTILPVISTIERLCANSLVAAEHRIEGHIAGRLNDTSCKRLDSLLVELIDGHLSRFVWLRKIEPGKNSADINRLLDRLSFLQNLGLSPGILANIPPHRVARLKRQGERYFADGLSDLSDNRRLSILAVCAVEWQADIADAIIETHDRIVGKTWREAKRLCDARVDDAKAAVHIPGYPPTYSDNIRPFVPGYPPSFDALP